MNNKEFTLPLDPQSSIYEAERQRAIEDRLKQRAEQFQGIIVPGAEVGVATGSTPMDVINGGLESRGFVAGSTGWRIMGNGDVEFGSGVFRGSARFVQPAAKRRRAVDAFNIAAGTYFVDGLTTVEFEEGGIVSASSSITAPRKAIYTAVCGIKVHNDETAFAAFGLYLRRGTTVSATGGTLIAANSGIVGGSGNGHFNAATPVLLQAGEKIWMSIEAVSQWDLLADPATFIALAYSSEAV